MLTGEEEHKTLPMPFDSPDLVKSNITCVDRHSLQHLAALTLDFLLSQLTQQVELTNLHPAIVVAALINHICPRNPVPQARYILCHPYHALPSNNQSL